MKTTAFMAIVAAQIFALPLSAQTFDREGRLVVAPEERNIAAAQVAVAQTRLFGSMLVSYRIARPGVARVADAILSAGKRYFPNAELEVLPPHRPGMAWRTRIGSRLLTVSFDNKGVARFGQSAIR